MDDNKDNYLTIGQLAKMFHISNRTLRYYEEKGILKPHHIAPNGYRYYSENQILVLDMIRCFRNLGIPIDNIIEQFSERQWTGSRMIFFRSCFSRNRKSTSVSKRKKKTGISEPHGGGYEAE